MYYTLLRIVYTTALVSASGALSPGPLTVTTFALGSRYGWKGGFMVALGHTLVELPYMILLYFFLSSIEGLLQGIVGHVITLIGASIVMFFAITTIRDALGSLKLGSMPYTANTTKAILRHPVVIGILFTGLNVWFLIWWLSIGLGLISLAASIGIIGIFLIFLSHVWLDYLWLGLVAEAGRRGARLVGSKGYSILMIVLGTVLALFGINMLLKRFLLITILP